MLVLVDTLHELLPAAHLLGVPINGPMDGPRFQGEPGQAYRHCRKREDKEHLGPAFWAQPLGRLLQHAAYGYFVPVSVCHLGGRY